MAHKFAEYLQVVFKHWHVDCEYNRDGHEQDPKRLPLPSNRNSEQVQDTTVYPDIIVHRRGQALNLLVIEVKKSSNNDSAAVEFDRVKVASCVDHLGYKLGLFITFRTDASLTQPYTPQWEHRRTSDTANEVRTR